MVFGGTPIRDLTVEQRINLVCEADADRWEYSLVRRLFSNGQTMGRWTPFALALLGAPIADEEKLTVEVVCARFGLGTDVATAALSLLSRFAAAGGVWNLPDQLASGEIGDAALDLAWRAARTLCRLPLHTGLACAMTTLVESLARLWMAGREQRTRRTARFLADTIAMYAVALEFCFSPAEVAHQVQLLGEYEQHLPLTGMAIRWPGPDPSG